MTKVAVQDVQVLAEQAFPGNTRLADRYRRAFVMGWESGFAFAQDDDEQGWALMQIAAEIEDSAKAIHRWVLGSNWATTDIAEQAEMIEQLVVRLRGSMRDEPTFANAMDEMGGGFPESDPRLNRGQP